MRLHGSGGDVNRSVGGEKFGRWLALVGRNGGQCVKLGPTCPQGDAVFPS